MLKKKLLSPSFPAANIDGEVALRASFIRLGGRIVVGLFGTALVYSLLTWNRPHRAAMVAILVGAVAVAMALKRNPRENLDPARRERFFISWSGSYLAVVTALSLLDGGATSPMAMQFFALVTWLALVPPRRSVHIMFAADLVAYLVIAAVDGAHNGVQAAFVAVLLGCVGFVSQRQAQMEVSWREQLMLQRDDLRAAEAESNRRVAQQAAMAELGVRALSGTDLEALFADAVKVLCSGLEVPAGALLRLEPSGDAFQLVGGASYSAYDRVVVPRDRAPQACLTLESGVPLLVDDILQETRFDTSALAEVGVRSSMSAPVAGPDEGLWGVLAAQAAHPAAFGDEDLGYLVGVANVLAGAIARAGSEDELMHRSLHDPLTGLPNRALLIDRLEHALARSRRDGSSLAVLFLDIDDFKGINDSLGHDAGDTLLKELAPRLSTLVREGDTLARFGGDEFVVLCESIGDPSQAAEVAERILGVFEEPFQLDSEVFVTASVGVATGDAGYPGHAQGLVRDADAAMYRAKERGRGRYEMFDDALRARIVQRVRTENELRRAVERDELRLVWQPLIRLGTGRVHAAEALVRWQHPERGLLTPNEFIPIAEETGLIVPLGEWVIREAFKQAAAWMRSDDPLLASFRAAVNLSARQLADDRLVDTIRDAMEHARLAPGRMVFEITESTLIEDPARCAKTLREIADLGLGVAIDDFGTGYSSLGSLKHLDLDAIKIDRSLVTGLAEGTRDSAIIEAVVAMSRALDLRLVAEGVECEEELRELRRLGCDLAQGFYFAKPVPAKELEALVADGLAWPEGLPEMPETLVPPPPVRD